jgi:hypothetical protein
MNRSLLAFDFVGPPLILEDYFLQQSDYGDDEDDEDLLDSRFGAQSEEEDQHEHESADEAQLADFTLAWSRSQSQSQSPSADSASSSHDLDLPVPREGDLYLQDDFDHAFAQDLGQDLDFDFDFDSEWHFDLNSANDNDSDPPSRASPSSSSRSIPFSVGPSPSPGHLFNSDSSADLEVDLGSDSELDSASGPDLDADLDLDLDSGQDTDQVATDSSPSSPNPDPLVDRPRHHLQSNDINNGGNIGLYWNGLPPRNARPARASLTPDINPNRRLPGPPTRPYHHRHRPHHHSQHRQPHPHHPPRHNHDHPAPPLDNCPPPPFAIHRQSHHLGLGSQPGSLPRPPFRNNQSSRPLADPADRNPSSQRPHRHNHLQQREAAPAGFQHLQDQREQDHSDEGSLPLQQHLLLRRARRAARVAREAGRLRPGRGNWGPARPARPERGIIAEDPFRSGLEELDQSDSMDQDDELIEVVFEGRASAPPNPARRQQRHIRPPRQQQRRRNHQQHGDNNNLGLDLVEVDVEHDLNLGRELDPHQDIPVIDLTEEPDSPDLQRHRPVNIFRHNNQNHIPNHRHDQIHILDFDDEEEEVVEEEVVEEEEEVDNLPLHQHPRHPRRHMAQDHGRMPSLNRSDGSILNDNAAAVIDLTLDSSDDTAPANRRLPHPPAALINHQPAHRNHHRRLPGPAQAPPAAVAPAHRTQYIGRHLIGSLRGLIPGLLAQAVNNPREADVQFVQAVPLPPPFPMNPNPLAGNPPEFNYQANGFGVYGQQPTPKPDFQAPPASRPGFTRDTRTDGGDDGAGEDLVVVCPSCDNELKYSPGEEDDNPRPAKKARGKKSQEEHHFWAVKNCGHVGLPYLVCNWFRPMPTEQSPKPLPQQTTLPLPLEPH